jgi:ribosomal protein S18 acetylase RimI-like enzyme
VPLLQSTDKAKLQAFFERRRALNAYALGDLDEPHWSRTDWWTWEQDGKIQEVALLYKGFDPPILIALQNNSPEGMQALIRELSSKLPDHVYAHLTPGLREILEARFDFHDHGEHFVMELKSKPTGSQNGPERLRKENAAEVDAFFDKSYPGHWFRPDMLEMGPYFGIRNGGGQLVAAGGVHIFSTKYSVAALGNITTLPSHRGRGHGKQVSQTLCNYLIDKVETIGLNVVCANTTAIKIYRDLGFEPIITYSEFTLTKRGISEQSPGG